MAIVDLEEKLAHEIDWRTSEISIVKTIPFLYEFSTQQREVLQKHTIPIFYSLWEGFVVESFAIYTRELNSLTLSKDQVCINILVHSIDLNVSLKNGRMDFNKQVELISAIANHLDKPVVLPVNVPTDSNVNLKVINNLLYRYNLNLLPNSPYKDWLNKLLLFRNKLAHGEYSIPITQEHINEMSSIVINSMHAIAEKILEGYQNRSYTNV